MKTETSPVGVDESLEERIKKLEKENRGLIGDLAGTRQEKRQLEERLTMIEKSIEEANREPEVQVPTNEKVAALAQDPDGYISKLVEDRVERRIQALEQKTFQDWRDRQVDKALAAIAEKEGKSISEVRKKYDEPLAEIVKSRGLVNLDPEIGIKTAHEIYLLQQQEAERKEKEREEAIDGQSTAQVKPSTKLPSGGMIKRSQVIEMMQNGTYNSRKDEIHQAMKEGRIIDDIGGRT